MIGRTLSEIHTMHESELFPVEIQEKCHEYFKKHAQEGMRLQEECY